MCPYNHSSPLVDIETISTRQRSCWNRTGNIAGRHLSLSLSLPSCKSSLITIRRRITWKIIRGGAHGLTELTKLLSSVRAGSANERDDERTLPRSSSPSKPLSIQQRRRSTTWTSRREEKERETQREKGEAKERGTECQRASEISASKADNMSSNIDRWGHAGDTSESKGTLPDVQIYARKSASVRSIWELTLAPFSFCTRGCCDTPTQDEACSFSRIFHRSLKMNN